MKTSVIVFILFFLSYSYRLAFSQDATGIIRTADEKMQGEKTSISSMTMTIVRPTWERTISFKNWSKGRDYALTLVTAPAKEQGQAFLKQKNDIWNWNPKISRMIKLPPSMMSQGWMGSDFSNDDLLKESSIVVDYTHKLLGEETIEGWDCYIIELLPHEDAPVVWGKIIMWISRDEYLQMKSEYYDEDGYLIKTEFSYDVKKMDDRIIPTRFELIPEEEEGNKTIVTLDNIKFNESIEDSFFSQQNMKQIR